MPTFPNDRKWYVLDGKAVVEVPTLMDWAEWAAANPQARFLAQTRVPGGVVSTIFLGFDHNVRRRILGEGEPHLFETAHLREDDTQILARYATYDEALAGHHAAVQRLAGADK